MNCGCNPVAEDPTARIGSASLVRPRYAPGIVLLDTDLERAVSYQLERSRLILRALLGCGVLCGLRVTARLDERCQRLSVTVGCGIALDGCGDPIELCNPVTLTVEKHCGEWPADRFWVVLRRREWSCEPRSAHLPCEEGEGESGSEPTRIREGFELRLAKREPCLCWPRPDNEACDPDQNRNETQDEREGRLARCIECPPCGCGPDDWVLLGTLERLKRDGEGLDPDHWQVSHVGRRWLRPVLQADPLAGLVVFTRPPAR